MKFLVLITLFWPSLIKFDSTETQFCEAPIVITPEPIYIAEDFNQAHLRFIQENQALNLKHNR
jgi:hypothetical protein